MAHVAFADRLLPFDDLAARLKWLGDDEGPLAANAYGGDLEYDGLPKIALHGSAHRIEDFATLHPVRYMTAFASDIFG